jgi:hypothetical protein
VVIIELTNGVQIEVPQARTVESEEHGLMCCEANGGIVVCFDLILVASYIEEDLQRATQCQVQQPGNHGALKSNEHPAWRRHWERIKTTATPSVALRARNAGWLGMSWARVAEKMGL